MLIDTNRRQTKQNQIWRKCAYLRFSKKIFGHVRCNGFAWPRQRRTPPLLAQERLLAHWYVAVDQPVVLHVPGICRTMGRGRWAKHVSDNRALEAISEKTLCTQPQHAAKIHGQAQEGARSSQTSRERANNEPKRSQKTPKRSQKEPKRSQPHNKFREVRGRVW